MDLGFMIRNYPLSANFFSDSYCNSWGPFLSQIRKDTLKSTTFIPYITHLPILYGDCRLVM